MNKIKAILTVFIILVLLGAIGSSCADTSEEEADSSEELSTDEDEAESEYSDTLDSSDNDEDSQAEESEYTESLSSSSTETQADTETAVTDSDASESAEQTTSFDLSQVPAYSGNPVAVINDNNPFFTADQYTTEVFENYSNLDSLGRCGVAFANICTDLMPTEPRGAIGMVKPSGWHTVKYNGLVDGNYLYNRCHLIAYELAGENANEKNLITGTRYMNVEGMLPYENDTKSYVERTGHHVLYRVTPIFEGNNLVVNGVLMEAHSVEDNDFYFCVYCYNVQPGISIDYATGESELDGSKQAASDSVQPQDNMDNTQADDAGTDNSQSGDSNIDNSQSEAADVIAAGGADAAQQISDTTEKTYVVNTNTKKFHNPDCSSADDIKPKNKEIFTGDRQTLIDQGYEPCKRCNP